MKHYGNYLFVCFILTGFVFSYANNKEENDSHSHDIKKTENKNLQNIPSQKDWEIEKDTIDNNIEKLSSSKQTIIPHENRVNTVIDSLTETKEITSTEPVLKEAVEPKAEEKINLSKDVSKDVKKDSVNAKKEVTSKETLENEDSNPKVEEKLNSSKEVSKDVEKDSINTKKEDTSKETVENKTSNSKVEEKVNSSKEVSKDIENNSVIDNNEFASKETVENKDSNPKVEEKIDSSKEVSKDVEKDSVNAKKEVIPKEGVENLSVTQIEEIITKEAIEKLIKNLNIEKDKIDSLQITDKKKKISFKGDVEYRLSYYHKKSKDHKGISDTAIGDYTNLYAWNLKMDAFVSKNLSFGFRLSNPNGSATDTIQTNLNKLSKNPLNLISLPEMNFLWTRGMVSISGGIIPVYSNTTLSLAAFENRKFKHAVTSWKDYMNNSQAGLDLGLKFIQQKNLKLDLNIVSAIAKNNIGATAKDASYKFKNDQLRFILSLPTSLLNNKLTLNPCVHLRTNVYRSSYTGKSNSSLVGGLDFEYYPVKLLSFRAGFAIGGYKNNSQKDEPNYDTLETSPLGMLTVASISVNPNFGKGILIYKWSNSKDRKESESMKNNMMHLDVKYEFPINKLTIMPGIRIWYAYKNISDNVSTTMEIQPELILKACF